MSDCDCYVGHMRATHFPNVPWTCPCKCHDVPKSADPFDTGYEAGLDQRDERILRRFEELALEDATPPICANKLLALIAEIRAGKEQGE